MDKSIKRFFNFTFFISTISGSLFIIHYDGADGSIRRILPLFIIVLYSLVLMKGLSLCPDNAPAEKNINTLFPMGLLFSVLAVFSLLIHLKAKGAGITTADAAAMALSYLFMALTSSAGALAFRYVIWRLYASESDPSGEKGCTICDRDWNIPA